tara:strand:+ start:441 stop:5336 length:4896 start_codon:yes stop_codon:yes gene_type:complete
MAQQFLTGVKITAGDENTLFLNTGATNQQPAIFYQVNGSNKFEQRVGSNFELYNYTRSNWDFHLQGSTGYLALGHNAPGAGLHVKGTTNLASRFIFTKDLSTDKILFGGADHDNFDTFVGSSSNHSFTITQNGAAAVTIDTSKNANFTGTVTAKGQLNVVDSDGTLNHIRAHSNSTEGFLTVSNGSNWGFIVRGPGNDPRIGAWYGGVLKIEGFHSSDGATGANAIDFAQFDFGNDKFQMNAANSVFAGDVTVNGGDFNLTKQNGSPTINMLWDGNNPGTDTLLHYLNYKVDYSGTHQDWGGIEHRTTTSATRTKLNFNVKSTGGSVLNALSLDGTTDGTAATFGGRVTSPSTFISSSVGTGNPTPATDNVRFNGYGMIGNRGNLYVTNSNSSGIVQIGVGGAHNSNPKLTVGGTDSTFLTNLGVGGAPGAKLDVNSGAANTVAIFESTDDKAFVILKDSDTSTHLITKDNKFSIGEDSTDYDNFKVDITTGDTNIAGGGAFGGNVTIGSGSTSATRSLTLLTNSEQDTVINLKESSANYGFSLNYDGVANDFIIKRHDNSASGTDVLTLNRTDNNAVFAGSVTATSFSGDGSNLTGITSTDSTKVAKAGDTMSGDLIISKTDPTITLVDSSGANTDPNGTIIFSEVSGTQNFDINYNGASDRLEFRGRVGNNDNTDLAYINRDLTTTLEVLGGATFAGDVTINKSDPVLILNDTSTNDNQAQIWLRESADYGWQMNYNSDSNDFFTLDIVDGGTVSNALTINRSLNATFTGAVNMASGKITSDGSAAAGAYFELKHANNNSTDVCATINLTNNTGGYAAIVGGTTGANNTGYIQFKTDNAGTQSTVLTLNGDNSSVFNGNVEITGDTASPHTDNAFIVYRGSDGSNALRVQNSGEVVVQNNYLYAAGAGVSLYVQAGAVIRGSISNDGGDVRIADNLVVTGNLTVDGTTTTLNTQTVEVEDNIIQLNTTQGSPDTATAATSGISIYRGDGVTQASFIFDDGDDTWNLTDSLEVASNITLGSAIVHAADTNTNITFSTGQILLQTSTNGNYLNIHNNGINYYNASSHNFTGAIICNNKVTADLGFTSHNQRGVSTNPSLTEEYPLGHYTGGKEIWSLDTTWSNSQLQEYFNSTNVEWYEDSTAPAGYSIKIDGAVNTGGYYGSGFPYIPIEEGSIYLIEVYIRNESGSSIGHYMGTQDFEHDFTATASGSGNPGSYGYHLMANHNPGTDWQHRYAFVSGHHNSDYGKFETDAKYFTPHSLFNYSHNSGTRRCYISGWRVTRIAEQEFFAQGTAAKPAIVLDDGVYNSVPNSGLYREWYDGSTATKDQISVSIDGTRRLRVNEAGVWTDENFYVGGDWRTFSSTWDASAGTSGAGFRFHNTHTDTNGIVALTISATGDGVFGGTMTAKGATINSPTGSGQDTIINLTGTNTSNFGSTYAVKSQIKSIAIGNTNAYASKLIFSTNDTSNNLNPALQIDENQNVEVYGNVRHQGTTMTEGTDVDQYKYFPMTFQLSANTWTDTGIDGTDLATGVYAMQVYVSDFNVGGGHYYEYYSGMLSWYADSTNSTHVDEIPIHRAGHAPNSGDVQFRTQRASGSDTHDLMLQVKHNLAYTGALDNSNGGKIMRFKFRRLI